MVAPSFVGAMIGGGGVRGVDEEIEKVLDRLDDGHKIPSILSIQGISVTKSPLYSVYSGLG